ncbi:MAG: response regulator, partial [Sphingobacteriales bacterium]
MPQILIIDDDHDICFLLNKFFTKHGYQVHEALNVKRAFELIDEHQNLDVVLCDYRLDGTDGKIILQRIKQKYPLLPVIIITGYNDLKTAVELMKLGAYDYVLKPLFPEEILNTINAAVAGNQPAVESRAEDNLAGFSLSREKKKNAPVTGDYIFGNSAV